MSVVAGGRDGTWRECAVGMLAFLVGVVGVVGVVDGTAGRWSWSWCT
ncbi:hypothetical protein ABT075_37085 [Streptomyces sp. NPDC002677]